LIIKPAVRRSILTQTVWRGKKGKKGRKGGISFRKKGETGRQGTTVGDQHSIKLK